MISEAKRKCKNCGSVPRLYKAAYTKKWVALCDKCKEGVEAESGLKRDTIKYWDIKNRPPERRAK